MPLFFIPARFILISSSINLLVSSTTSLFTAPVTGLPAQKALVDCQYSSTDGSWYDFNPLIEEKSWPLNLTTSKSTPPSTTIESILLSLCKKLPKTDNDQSCPDGTLVCMYIYNQIGSDRRLEKVIPIAVDKTPVVIQGGGVGDKEPLELRMQGLTYNGVQQSASFTLSCSKTTNGATTSPTTQYNPLSGLLNVTWSTPTACASTGKRNSGRSEDDSSSSFRTFLFLVFLSFAAYLTIGSWYNYSTYGTTGWDALPNQDFWKELPAVLHELLCSRSRSGGGGTRAGYTSI